MCFTLEALQHDAGMTSFFKAFKDAKETDVDGQKVLKLEIQELWDLKKLQLKNAQGTTHSSFRLREEYRTLLQNLGTDN